jgi:hypothetical protein
MKLLATLCNNTINPNNLIAVVDPWTGVTRIIKQPFPAPTSINGICKTPDGYLAGIIPNGRTNPCALWVLDKELKTKGLSKLPSVLDIHSICFHKGVGQFLVVSTRTNSVWCVGTDDGLVYDEIVKHSLSNESFDKFHLNSIAMRENDVLVSALGNRQNPGQVWHYRMNEGRIFNLRTNEDLIPPGTSHPHSIKFLEDGQLVYCDSGTNSLVRENGEKVQLDGYARGLAFDQNYFYVGVSTVRSYSLSTGLPYNDKDPGFEHPGIWVIRRPDGEKIKKISLSNYCSEIYDLEWLCK